MDTALAFVVRIRARGGQCVFCCLNYRELVSSFFSLLHFVFDQHNFQTFPYRLRL